MYDVSATMIVGEVILILFGWLVGRGFPKVKHA